MAVRGSILLVEDVEDNRALARLLLEARGLTVCEASNGEEALRQATAQVFALILMDLALPEMDGFEVSRRLRKLPQCAGVPIVAVTAHAMAGDRERILAAGFAGYIAKPLEVSRFAAQVEAHLLGDRHQSVAP